MALKKSRFTVRDFAYTIVMTALTCVVTMTVRVPTPLVGGYTHLGDVVQIFASLAFGWVVGGIAGGVGSALADLLGGYPFWAPITLVIRGIEGIIIGKLGYQRNIYWKISASIIGMVFMMAGYFGVYVPLYGWAAAVASTIPFTVPKIVISMLIAIPLYYAVLRAYPRLNVKAT
jgi:uncharacterized membrane protein